MSTQNCGITKCAQKLREGRRGRKREREIEIEREEETVCDRERERERIKWNKIAVSFLIFECYY